LGDEAMRKLRFDEWWYGGPYLRVANPDIDLPRRDPTAPISDAFLTATELDGMVNGERFVAPFHDANSVDEILAGLLVSAEYPDGWDESERYFYPTIQGSLAEITLRLETKLRRKPGKARATCFSAALDAVRSAVLLFAAGNYSAGQDQLWLAHNILEAGNRSRRRRASFIVAPDGSVESS
jgi:hypothetical protein